jgi:hypothetical protein
MHWKDENLLSMKMQIFKINLFIHIDEHIARPEAAFRVCSAIGNDAFDLRREKNKIYEIQINLIKFKKLKTDPNQNLY